MTTPLFHRTLHAELDALTADLDARVTSLVAGIQTLTHLAFPQTSPTVLPGWSAKAAAPARLRRPGGGSGAGSVPPIGPAPTPHSADQRLPVVDGSAPAPVAGDEAPHSQTPAVAASTTRAPADLRGPVGVHRAGLSLSFAASDGPAHLDLRGEEPAGAVVDTTAAGPAHRSPGSHRTT